MSSDCQRSDHELGPRAYEQIRGLEISLGVGHVHSTHGALDSIHSASKNSDSIKSKELCVETKVFHLHP